MRIASSTIYDIGTQGIQTQLSELATLQEEISSGKSVNTPSDDPLAAAEAVSVQQASDTNVQYATNQSSATSALQLEDSTLTSISTTISSIQTLLGQAGDPSLTNQERSGLASQLQSAEQQLVSLGNTTTATGAYLFGGFQTQSPPFSISSTGTVTYNGDAGQQLTQVANGIELAVGDPGSSLFQQVQSGVGPSIAYASSTNTGDATFSAVSVTNSADPTNADGYQIQFTVANGITTFLVLNTTTDSYLNGGVPQQYTAGDTTVNGVTTEGSGSQTISLGGQSINISGTPGNNDSFTILPAQSAGLTTAASPAITNTGSGTIGDVTVTNAEDPTIFAPYTINFSVVGGVTSYTVTNTDTGTTSAAQTYTAPATVDLGTGLTVQVNGAPANGDSFTVQQENQGVNLFTTLNNVIAALNNPDDSSAASAALTNTLTTATAQVGNAENNILTLRAQVGARQQQLSTLTTDNSTAQLQFSSTLSTLTDTNIVSAYSEYSQVSVALQAAEKTFVQTESLTLFSIIQ